VSSSDGFGVAAFRYRPGTGLSKTMKFGARVCLRANTPLSGRGSAKLGERELHSITHRRTEKTVRSGADGMKAKIGPVATMSP